MKRRAILGPIAAFLLAQACDGGPGPTAPTPPETPPQRVTVSGTVSDRISGSPAGLTLLSAATLSGSTITFTGPLDRPEGQRETKTSPVDNNRYEVPELLPGDYEVTITGGSHVEHKNLRVPVSAGDTDRPFSLLVFGSGKFGAVYDQTFHDFFTLIARGGDCANCLNAIQKWELPVSIYVTEGQLTTRGWDLFMTTLQSINNESVPAMFGRASGGLPIETGPPVPNNRKQDSIVIFFSPDPNTAATAHDPSSTLRWAWIRLSARYYDTDEREQEVCCEWRKHVLAHELFHAAFARHAFNTPLSRSSLMGGWSDIRQMSPEDKLTSWIVYHPDTHPGNKAPDTNPTYK